MIYNNNRTRSFFRLTKMKLVAALVFLIPFLSFSQWVEVGTTNSAGSSFQQLVIAPNGDYYVSYYDVPQGKGSVEKFNGTQWSYAGGIAGITTATATYSGLAGDASGNVYYCNQNGYPNSGMNVRQFNGTSWTSLPDPISTTINFQAIAVSPSGIPVVAHSSGGKVQRYVNGAWEQIGTTGFASGVPYYLDIVVGSNNKVYVSFNTGSTVSVYENDLLAPSTQAWTHVGGGTSVASATSSEQFRSSIAIDGNNNLYLAYTSLSAGGNKINVQKFNGTSWSQLGSENFSTHRVHYVSIAVSASGTPFVAYSHFENSPNNQNYVWKFDGTEWVALGGPISSGESKWNSLAVDASGNPVLAYSDSQNNKTKVAKYVLTQPCSGDPGPNAGDLGCVQVVENGITIQYTTVRGDDGNIWMQQNLGSSQVAASSTDELSYGGLYQWGRWTDGHQIRTSTHSTVTPTPNDPQGLVVPNSNFIGSTPKWWGTNTLTDTWTAETPAEVTSTNSCDPCKALGNGWKLPSQTDWETVIAADTITNIATAFGSRLKLTVGGTRVANGGFSFVGQRGYYWSSTTGSLGGKLLYYSNAIVNPAAGYQREQGASIRCMKVVIPAVQTIDVVTQNGVPATISTNGGTLQVEAVITPAAANQDVIWSVVNVSGSATISTGGLVTATANGTVYAKAVSVENAAVKDSLLITISNQNTCAPVSEFYENFDAPTLTCCDMGVVPECWASISTMTGANQIISNTTPASGTNNIYQTGYGAGKISIVVMREVNNINAGTHQFRFKLRANSGPGNLDFGYITDINDASTFVVIQTINVTNNSYIDPLAERTFSVPTSVPSNARLAIRNPGTSWAGFYWDDAYWEPIVSTPVQTIDVVTQNGIPATITTHGGTLQVEAVITPAAANQDVIWSIVNVSGSATISTDGLVTATENGTVYAKAVSVEDAALKDSLLITISNQIVLAETIDVVTQNGVPATIAVNGGTLQVEAVITPADANQEVVWSVVNGTGTASISATGLVTAITNGVVYAKAVSVENNELKDSLAINISNQPVAVESLDVITVNNAPAVINTHSGTLQVQAVVLPSQAPQTVNWSIVNVTGSATISISGLISATGNGTVYAKAVSVSNPAVKDSLLITITNQNTVGLSEKAAAIVDVYPNPVSDVVYLKSSADHNDVEIRITDLSGKVYAAQKLAANSMTDGKSIDVSGLASGTYFIVISNTEIRESHMIIKQ